MAELLELRQRIIQRLSELTQGPVEVVELEPLGGGACQDNYRVDLKIRAGALAGTCRTVLRSDPARSLPGSLRRGQELEVIQAAVSRNVMTPAAYWLSPGLVQPKAEAYFMDWVEGAAIGRQLVKLAAHPDFAHTLGSALAAELARIHSINPTSHPALFTGSDRRDRTDPVGAALEQIRGTIDGLPVLRPAIELCFDWLTRHRPEAGETTLVHGDFRTGNFMVTPAGLTAVLDWEFAHFGSPYEDLAWLAVRDWRFGALKKPIGGFADRATFYEAYRHASGRALSPGALHWWEVFGNLRWAAGALMQGERYYQGERDLELIAIARRAGEMEYEALRLIEKGPIHAPST